MVQINFHTQTLVLRHWEARQQRTRTATIQIIFVCKLSAVSRERGGRQPYEDNLDTICLVIVVTNLCNILDDTQMCLGDIGLFCMSSSCLARQCVTLHGKQKHI